ncbi:hypothetical protein KM92DES2_10776 [uncultured Desulfovibrio sp.]|uniref:Uncharacterized protein n=1 Tax=uncultured Desulfovibrio sp. TaxID=167968 RepID=A0A212JAP4_9BACT|nr:hypothetical protein KM92DES2_10776 [uncultured Desulfovibrio sp.]
MLCPSRCNSVLKSWCRVPRTKARAWSLPSFRYGCAAPPAVKFLAGRGRMHSGCRAPIAASSSGMWLSRAGSCISTVWKPANPFAPLILQGGWFAPFTAVFAFVLSFWLMTTPHRRQARRIECKFLWFAMYWKPTKKWPITCVGCLQKREYCR